MNYAREPVLVLAVVFCSAIYGALGQQTGCGAGGAAPSPSAPFCLSADGAAELHAYLYPAQPPDREEPLLAKYETDAQEFYQAFPGRLPWLLNSGPTPQALALIQNFQQAASRGLDPEDYGAALWTSRLAKLKESSRTESDLIHFDVALTVSAMRYVSDLHVGRVNPRMFHFDLDINQHQYKLPQFVAENLVAAADVNAVLASAEPPFSAYHRTVRALQTYLEFARKDDGELLPSSKRPIAPGDTYPGVPRLIRLLRLVGDLPADADVRPDSLVYEGPLVDAVKHFQMRHGLDATGRIDVPTLRQLNTPLSQRVTELQLVLERFRWVPHEFEQPPIVVNIPEFRLHADNEQLQWVLSMKVVVGRAYQHKTPVFSTQMTYVTFRPNWNVPIEIQRKEIVPEIEKHPEQMQKENYEIVNAQGSVVDADVTKPDVLAQLRSGELAIRQKPGPGNSLGLIKFGMPNPYDIYLHATPATQLFSRARRDFSHGCIRVEDPVALAVWVLRGIPGWTEERISEAMNAEESLTVTLPKSIPVLIVYGTALAMENGEVHFFNDIYKYDAQLEKALAALKSGTAQTNQLSN
jgi:L,D-transpeptidase YcbB